MAKHGYAKRLRRDAESLHADGRNLEQVGQAGVGLGTLLAMGSGGLALPAGITTGTAGVIAAVTGRKMQHDATRLAAQSRMADRAIEGVRRATTGLHRTGDRESSLVEIRPHQSAAVTQAQVLQQVAERHEMARQAASNAMTPDLHKLYARNADVALRYRAPFKAPWLNPTAGYYAKRVRFEEQRMLIAGKRDVRQYEEAPQMLPGPRTWEPSVRQSAAAPAATGEVREYQRLLADGRSVTVRAHKRTVRAK